VTRESSKGFFSKNNRPDPSISDKVQKGSKPKDGLSAHINISAPLEESKVAQQAAPFFKIDNEETSIMMQTDYKSLVQTGHFH